MFPLRSTLRGQIMRLDRANAYQRKAHECECAAARVSDPNVRAAYLDMASRWREMAERQQAIERKLSDVRKPPE